MPRRHLAARDFDRQPARPRAWRPAAVLLTLALGLLPFWPAPRSRALDAGKAPTQYVHDVWGVREGLPQDSVRAVCQTRDGYLWLGTLTGLARFDGVRFTVFDGANTAGALRNDNVVALLQDATAEDLWIGTDRGLHRLHDGAFTAFTTADGLSNDFVRALCQDHTGALWVGTYAGLNVRRGDGRFSAYTTRDGLPNDLVWAVAEDRDGDLWVGTDNGLCRRGRDGAFTTFPPDRSGLPAGNVRALLVDRARRLWVGGYAGLFRWENGRFNRVEAVPAGPVGSLCEDRDGNLWVGRRKGIGRLTGERFVEFTARDGLLGDRIFTVAEDRQGSVWFGGLNTGLNRFRDGTFLTITTREGLVHDAVNALVEDHAGTLWFATEGGVSALAPDGRWTNYTTRDGLPDDSVRDVCEDRRGDLWAATANGFARLHDGVWTTFRRADGLSADVGQSVYEDPQGDLWLGTYGGGVNRLGEGGRFSAVTTRQGLTHDTLRALHQDRAGNLWISTNRGVNVRHPDGSIRTYGVRDGLSSEVVGSIHEDAEGTLWLGTAGGGLNRFRDGRFAAVTSRDGLPEDTVHHVLEDDDGFLWLSGNKGIFRVAKREVNERLDGRRATVRGTVFGTADGMRTAECNGRNNHSGLRTRDGRLWFLTGDQGVVCLNPRTLHAAAPAPPVRVEGVTVDGQPRVAADAGSLRLEPGLGKLEIQYTALNFIAPERMRFRYRLQGLDPGWTEAGTRRTAFYTNLPPGAYRFQVAAMNEAGAWNEAGAGLALRLLPHFYQTRWFQVLVVIGLLGFGWLLAWLWHCRRLAHVRSKHALVLAERGRIAREIHDTLTQGFVGIRSQLQAATMALTTDHGAVPEAAHRHLALAQRMAQHSVAEARRAMGELRGDALEQRDLPAALLQEIETIRANSPDAPAVGFQVKGTPRRLPDPLGHGLLRITQEALTNVFKHAVARRVQVTLVYERGETRLEVSDDGRGFEPRGAFSTLDGHFGLLGMRERAAALGGRLQLQSAPGTGTRVVVTLPDRDPEVPEKVRGTHANGHPR